MTKGEARLRADRTTRQRARATVEMQYAQVKADLAAKGVGARAAGAVIDGTREAAEMGLEVARERKGVLAGTIGALLLWLFRKPIVDGASAAIERLRSDDAGTDYSETKHEEAEGDPG